VYVLCHAKDYKNRICSFHQHHGSGEIGLVHQYNVEFQGVNLIVTINYVKKSFYKIDFGIQVVVFTPGYRPPTVILP